MANLKYIFSIEFFYWINRKLEINLYTIESEKANKKELRLTIWKLHKLADRDDIGYCSNWWKHFTLLKFKNKNYNTMKLSNGSIVKPINGGNNIRSKRSGF